MSYVDSLTEEAKAIGSINTIYLSSNSPPRLVGTNTDYLGVKNAIGSALLSGLPHTPKDMSTCFEPGAGAALS
jgi:shikimate 5-dehydrogenase